MIPSLIPPKKISDISTWTNCGHNKKYFIYPCPCHINNNLTIYKYPGFSKVFFTATSCKELLSSHHTHKLDLTITTSCNPPPWWSPPPWLSLPRVLFTAGQQAMKGVSTATPLPDEAFFYFFHMLLLVHPCVACFCPTLPFPAARINVMFVSKVGCAVLKEQWIL